MRAHLGLILSTTLLALTLAACGSNGDNGPCTPGAMRSCNNNGCGSATQSCESDGTWGTCFCNYEIGVPEPVCQGTAVACSERLEGQCGVATGCVQGSCGGYSRIGFCFDQESIPYCIDPLCRWDYEFDYCGLGVDDCSLITVPSDCRTTGCDWSTTGPCAGTATACERITDRDACASQLGCEPICDDGSTWCDGACIDTTANDDHCGGCGITCGTGTHCESSLCACDAPSCGSCGTVCTTPDTCTAAQCAAPNASVLWVLSSLRLPDVNEAGRVDGFNLDDRVSSTFNDEGCQRLDATSPSGTPGIDNELARLAPLVDPILSSQFGTTVGQSVESVIFSGTLLVGVVFTPNGSTYDVSIVELSPDGGIDYDSSGIEAGQTWEVVGAPLATITGVTSLEGRVVLRGFSLDIELAEVVGSPTLAISSGVLQLDLGPTAGEAMLAGGADPTPFRDAVPGASLLIRSDLRLSGSSTCNGVSAGLHATFVTGTLAP